MNEQNKKGTKIKIAGFTIDIKVLIVVVLLIVGFIIFSMVSADAKRKADELEAQKYIDMDNANTTPEPVGGDEYDIHAQIQESLRAQYGNPPEGFEWGYAGELIALGDEDHTCEDVVYMFLRSLSILDFSTAERYSSNSIVISQYQNYYNPNSDALTDYYRNFLRKQFKVSLTSLEIGGISDVAVFADGTEYLTITVSMIDLTDKDFWQSDRDSLFSQMRVYRETETDGIKADQYVYEYIYDKYETGAIGKRDRTIELVVTKQNGGGWLVSGDRELCAYLQYENGVDVAKYILNEFEEWYLAVLIQEQIDEVNRQNEQYSDSQSEG